MTKVTLTNLQKKDVTTYFELAKDVIAREFSELDQLFEEIRVIIGNTDDVRKGLFRREEEKFLDTNELFNITSEIFALENWAKPPKACVEINLSIFETFEPWLQKMGVRHECCHLVHFEDADSIYKEYLKSYSPDCINLFFHYKFEYCAHLCIIRRHPEDWLRKPIRFSKTMQSPSVLYNIKTKNEGKKIALQVCLQNIVHILTILYLYEQVPSSLKPRLKKYRKIALMRLEDFSRIIRRELPGGFPLPREWLSKDDFLSKETYFQKIQKMLARIDKVV